MDSKFLEQARATAATNKKSIELETEVQLLNEKLASEVVEQERIVQEEEERKRQVLREEMRKEMVAACWGLVLKCYELRTRQHKKC